MGGGKSKPVIHEESEFLENGFLLKSRKNLSVIGGVRVWPAARTLARLISEHLIDVRGKRVVELGCGLALPSLSACRAGALKVVATDRAELRDLVETNAATNHCTDLQFKEFDWLETEQADLGQADMIIAADVIYYEEQEPFLQALRHSFETTGAKEAVVAYRERTELDRCFLNSVILPEFDHSLEIFGEGKENVEIYRLRPKNRNSNF